MSTADLKQADLQRIGQSQYASIKELVDTLNAANDDHGSDGDWDAAREAIINDPLSVLVRSDWHEPGATSREPGQYQILISTGGPATRIIGELSGYGEPTTATLQAQDWFMPWTDVAGCDEDILLTYTQQFWFGE